MHTELTIRAREASLLGNAGDFRGMARLLEQLDADGSPAAGTWALALRSIVWLAFPSHGALADLDQLRRSVGLDPAASEAAATCCEALATAMIIAWDARALDAVIALHVSLVEEASSRERVAIDIARCWQSVFRGDYDVGATERVFAAANAEKDAALLVQAATVRALTVACSGDSERALELARRASMMGRSEGVPQAEYLAHIVLARLRRIGRQTHRSVRILQALEAIAPAPWHAWIAWEKSFAAGEAPVVEASTARPVDRAVSCLRSVLDAALGKERDAFARGASAFLREARASAFAHSESRQLVLAMTDDPIPHDLERLARWADGTTPLLPAELHGYRLRMLDGANAESATAYVVLHARATDAPRARRVISWGRGLLDESDLATLPQSRRVEGRIETLVASLALAGEEGRPEEECFAQTYGFEYVAERHRSVFDVLLHRTRAFLEGSASIVRANGRLRLVPERSFLTPDPRCAERVTDRLLRILAQRGQTSARAVAGELGISLRSAQEALAELSEQGACETHRDGRAITYLVEDTAFSEPTTRLHAGQLEESKGEPLKEER